MKTKTQACEIAYIAKLLRHGAMLLREAKEAIAELAKNETNEDAKEDLLEIAGLKRKGSLNAYVNSLELKLSLAENKAKEERTAAKRVKRVNVITESLSKSDVELKLSTLVNKIDNLPQPETPTDTLDLALMIKRKLDLEAALVILTGAKASPHAPAPKKAGAGKAIFSSLIAALTLNLAPAPALAEALPVAGEEAEKIGYMWGVANACNSFKASWDYNEIKIAMLTMHSAGVIQATIPTEQSIEAEKAGWRFIQQSALGSVNTQHREVKAGTHHQNRRLRARNACFQEVEYFKYSGHYAR